jgi:ankyrin repeat protein
VDNVNVADGRSYTALPLAITYNGNVDCVKYCLEMGANVNALSSYGYTPLHLASSPQGQVDVVRVLLDAGALVDTTDNYGRTALYYASCRKCVVVAQLLVDRGAQVSNVKLDNFYQQSLIGSPHALNHDQTVVLIPLLSLGYTNTVVQR